MTAAASGGSAYLQGDPDSPVAICTLASRDLLDDLARSPLAAQVAIIGPLETENVGLDKMLATALERPRIRWLVVCGDESRGRYQGQALRALFATGIDDQGRILGGRSRRARLASLRAEHVDAVRRQLRLVDLVGIHDLARIGEAVHRCRADDPGPFDETVTLPRPEPIVVPRHPFRLRTHDPNGFFVILLDRAVPQIEVEHYAPGGELMHRLLGPDAESLWSSIVEWGLVSRLEHAAYLGWELARAERALRQGLPYRQDEAGVLS